MQLADLSWLAWRRWNCLTVVAYVLCGSMCTGLSKLSCGVISLLECV